MPESDSSSSPTNRWPRKIVRPFSGKAGQAIVKSAAEQVVAGHAERLGLDVEQRVLDGAERQRYHAAGGGPQVQISLDRGAKGDSPIFADHGFAAVPAKIGTVP